MRYIGVGKQLLNQDAIRLRDLLDLMHPDGMMVEPANGSNG